MCKASSLRKGFTLIEMLLYVAASSFFLLSITTFFSFVMGTQSKNQITQEVNQQGVLVMERITQTIRGAVDVVTPSYGTSSQILSVSTNASATNPTSVYVTNGMLYIQEGTSTAVAISNSKVLVRNLSFINTSASTTQSGTVRVRFLLSPTSSSTLQEFLYEKEFVGSGSYY